MANTGWRTASAFTLAAVIGLSGTLAAQKPAKQKPNQVRQTDAEPAVPASQEMAAAEALLEQMTSQVSDDLVAIGHPDGTISMDLQGRFMSVMLIRTKADGSQAVACEAGHEALTDALTKKVPEANAVKPHTATTPVTTTSVAREIK
jgi:hypothetical protein